MAEIDQGNAKDTLLGVLTYIDSPFKFIVVIVLALMGFVGYFVYANQATLLGAYERSQKLPKTNPSRYEDAARLLVKATGADEVVFFEVNPIANTRISSKAFLHDMTRDKELEGMKVPLFGSNEANNKDAIELMAGRVPCGEYNSPQSELGYLYVAKGYTYACRVSVPTAPAQFAGQITLLWKTKPPKDPTGFMTIAGDMVTGE